MPVSHHLSRTFAYGLAYGTAAAISIVMSRGDGEFAMFWIATAMLVPWLLARRPRGWWPIIVATAAGGILATGLLGLGWRAAPFMAVANCVEAGVDVLIIRWVHKRSGSVTSLRATSATYLVGGIVGPLAGAGPAMLGLHLALHPVVWSEMGYWMLAHGLGFVALFPCTGLIAQARAEHRAILPERGKRLRAAAALGGVAVASVVCFFQTTSRCCSCLRWC